MEALKKKMNSSSLQLLDYFFSFPCKAQRMYPAPLHHAWHRCVGKKTKICHTKAQWRIMRSCYEDCTLLLDLACCEQNTGLSVWHYEFCNIFLSLGKCTSWQAVWVGRLSTSHHNPFKKGERRIKAWIKMEDMRVGDVHAPRTDQVLGHNSLCPCLLPQNVLFKFWSVAWAAHS